MPTFNPVRALSWSSVRRRPRGGLTTLSLVPAADHGNVDLALSTITDGASATPTVTLRIKGAIVDDEINTPTWWSPLVQMQGSAGKTPTVILPATGYWQKWATTQKMMWSYDRFTWKAFDNQDTLQTSRTASNNDPFTQDTVHVSLQPSIGAGDRPFHFSKIAALNPDRFRALPGMANGVALTIAGGRVGVSGQAIPTLPVLGAQIEDFSSTLAKRTLVMMMAQHPSEDHAERSALSFLRTMVQDDYMMARWRVLVYWLNPAGQYGGSRRTTFEGTGTDPLGATGLGNHNANRGYTDIPAVLADQRAYQARIASDLSVFGRTKVEAFLDFHGGPSADLSYTYAGPYSTTPLEQAVIAIWKQVRSTFYATVDPSTAGASFDWAKSAIAPNFSFSTEVGCGWGATAESSYDIFGAETAAVLKTATQQGLFPLMNTVGNLSSAKSGSNGIFDAPAPALAPAPRAAWSI